MALASNYSTLLRRGQVVSWDYLPSLFKYLVDGPSSEALPDGDPSLL